MPQEWVLLVCACVKQGVYGGGVSDPAQRHGGQPAQERVIRCECIDQRSHCVRVAPESGAVNGSGADIGNSTSDSFPHGLARRLGRNAMQRPGRRQARFGLAQGFNILLPGQGPQWLG